MKILHLDDHLLFAEGLSAVLRQSEKDLSVISANEATQALELVEQHPDLDLILVDLNMPGLDGFAFIDSLEGRGIYLPVVVLSATEDLWQVKRALKEGASGFIPKTYSTSEILFAMEKVLEGHVYVPEAMRQPLSELPEREPLHEQQRLLSAYKLGQRQLDVLKLMQEGYSNDEIATVLNLSKNTIKTHIRTLFSAFQVTNRIECVRYAVKIGLLVAA